MVERGGQVGRSECIENEGLARVVIPGEGGGGGMEGRLRASLPRLSNP